MKKIAYICFIVISTIMLQNCEDTYAPDLDYVTFESTSYELNVFPDETGTGEIKVFTTDISGTDRTLDVAIVEESTNATGYTVSETVTIPANTNEGIVTVTAQGEDIDPINGNTIVLKFSDVKSSTLYGDNITVKLVQVCPYTETFLNFVFDGYASETTWSVTEGTDIIYTGEPYTDGQVTTSIKMCLAPGTYTLTVNDVYGDGLSYPAEGSITITNGGTDLISIIGDFGYSTSKEFTIE